MMNIECPQLCGLLWLLSCLLIHPFGFWLLAKSFLARSMANGLRENKSLV